MCELNKLSLNTWISLTCNQSCVGTYELNEMLKILFDKLINIINVSLCYSGDYNKLTISISFE